MATTRDEAIQIIRDSPFATCEAKLASLLRESLRLRISPETERQVGASRMGGTPDLPQGVAWPERVIYRRARKGLLGFLLGGATPTPEGSRLSLSFMAQIRLGEAAGLLETSQLPSSGMLYFFYDMVNQEWGFDPAHRDGWRVLYVGSENGGLEPAVPPANLVPPTSPSMAIRLERSFTLPEEFPGEVESLVLGLTRSIDAQCELQDRLNGQETEDIHRMLGHSQNIQGPMERECEEMRARMGGDRGATAGGDLRMGADDWLLLLQLDSEEEHLGWQWGDAGRLYFWIRRQDLAARNFDAVWCILQCY